ncbi:MAG: GGDEF domain-containing protein [Culicoidibacterales bacterium]
MCWINLAYCAYFNRDETLAYTYYEQLLAHPYRNDIDELYYIRALNNAYSMSIANQNDIFITEIQDTFTSITTTDLAKRRSLRFTELYIEIQTLLQAETIDLQKLAPLKCEIEALLPLIEMRLTASRPDIMWIVLHGQICLKQGNISEGIQYFHQSLTLCETYQQHYSRSLTHDILSSVYEEQADFSSALIHAKASADIKSRSFHEHNHYYLTSLISEFDNKNLEIQIISNRSEKEQLESLVVQDQLTKLHNRHYLQQFMDKLPTSLPIQIAMIDIDFFKKYNDFYGHLKGDQLLINFASLLATCLSDYEVIRYGGEEFLVVGHAHSQQLFIRALRDFQVQLNHRHYTHHGINGTAIVSASIGYSYVSGGTHTDQILFTQLINQADQALYAAKAAGRNQCFAFENINC